MSAVDQLRRMARDMAANGAKPPLEMRVGSGMFAQVARELYTTDRLNKRETENEYARRLFRAAVKGELWLWGARLVPDFDLNEVAQ